MRLNASGKTHYFLPKPVDKPAAFSSALLSFDGAGYLWHCGIFTGLSFSKRRQGGRCLLRHFSVIICLLFQSSYFIFRVFRIGLSTSATIYRSNTTSGSHIDVSWPLRHQFNDYEYLQRPVTWSWVSFVRRFLMLYGVVDSKSLHRCTSLKHWCPYL